MCRPTRRIHDPSAYGGQVSRALAYGQHIAKETGGQYIVALNSDEFEKANEISEISFRQQLNSVKLTDDETGGLFGFRFDLA